MRFAIARRYGFELSVVHALPPKPRDQIPLEPLPGNSIAADLKRKSK